jgi:LruC domain-containing protein
MKIKKVRFVVILLLLFAGVTFTFTGCEHNYFDPSRQDDKSGSPLFGDSINIPADFDWATMRTVELNIEVDDQYNGAFFYTVELFNGHPFFDGNATMLGKGFAKKGQNFKSSLTIPTALETIFIKQIDPTGRERVTSTSVKETPNIAISFAAANSSLRSASVNNNTSITSNTVYTNSLRSVPSNVQLDYPTTAGAIVIDGSTTSPFTLETTKSYVIRGEYTGELIFPGSGNVELFIEGVWNNTSSNIIKLENNTKVVIQNGGKFTSTANVNIQGNDFVIWAVAPGGESNKNKLAKVSFDFNTNGQIINSGVFNAHTIKLPSAAVLYNAGDMEVEVFTINSANNIITNDNSLKVKDANFSNGKIVNNCHLVIENFSTNGIKITVSEGALFSVGTYTSVGGTTFSMYSNSIFEVTNSIKFTSYQNTIEGLGATPALLRMENIEFDGWQTVSFEGKLELENSNHTTTNGNNSYKLIAPASWVRKGESTLQIESSECNGLGNNAPEPELPPTDPTFPIIWTGSDITYMFEDRWPYLGDYDMNDVVLKLIPEYATDAANKVTQLKLHLALRAVGGTKRLAVGMQLDGILSNNIESVSRSNNTGSDNSVFPVSSNGAETGQTYAVLPFFDDVHRAFGVPAGKMVNTIEGEGSSPISVTITINFASPVNMQNVSIEKMNPFIVNGGYKESRDEVHLPGYAPTDKVDASRFGTADDNSNSKYYTSTENLMWALAIPSDIPYPKEYISIRQAYPNLEDWAKSAGANSRDWYLYPQQSLIFQK